MPENNYNAIVNQSEINAKLLALMGANPSYNISQVNGQRIFKIVSDLESLPEPSRKCEIFIGRIPHDCFEDVLVPLFQCAGELYEFRLMINFSGWNRGYAFAMYTNEETAANAIIMFNNYMIRPSWYLGVCNSINNCRIFIARIPAETPSEEIVRLLYAMTEEVEEVRIKRTLPSSSAIVEYKSHRGAAMARKLLVNAAATVWGEGARPAVDWSMPVSPQLLRQYREVGHMIDGRIVISRSVIPTGVFGLEPWSQARRMRMIRDAEISTQIRMIYDMNLNWMRGNEAPNYNVYNYLPANGVDINNNPIAYAIPDYYNNNVDYNNNNVAYNNNNVAYNNNNVAYNNNNVAYNNNNVGYNNNNFGFNNNNNFAFNNCVANGAYAQNANNKPKGYIDNNINDFNDMFGNLNMGWEMPPCYEKQVSPREERYGSAKAYDPWGLNLDVFKKP